MAERPYKKAKTYSETVTKLRKYIKEGLISKKAVELLLFSLKEGSVTLNRDKESA